METGQSAGLYRATSAQGFAFAAVTGELLAERVEGSLCRAPPVSVAPASLAGRARAPDGGPDEFTQVGGPERP